MLCLLFSPKPDHPHRLAEAARLPDEVGGAAGGPVPESQDFVGIGGDFPIAPQRRGFSEAGIIGQGRPCACAHSFVQVSTPRAPPETSSLTPSGRYSPRFSTIRPREPTTAHFMISDPFKI